MANTKSQNKLPPLPMLRAFEAAARTGSMRRAAEDIGVSHTVVSRNIALLERWIGRKLVTAGPRGVSVTPEGAVLLATVSTAFAAIADTAAQLRPQPGAAPIRIWCIPGLATRWLTPRLERIEAVVSGAEIVLRATDQAPDFTRDEADVHIGFGNVADWPEGAVALVRPRMFPVASPAWIAAHGLPEGPEALPRLPLIHEESHRQWSEWLAAAGVAVPGRLNGPRLWDANLGFDAALRGQGVALVSALLAAGEIDSGELVELFDTDIRLGGYFVRSGAGRGDGAVGELVKWLGRELAA